MNARYTVGQSIIAIHFGFATYGMNENPDVFIKGLFNRPLVVGQGSPTTINLVKLTCRDVKEFQYPSETGESEVLTVGYLFEDDTGSWWVQNYGEKTGGHMGGMTGQSIVRRCMTGAEVEVNDFDRIIGENNIQFFEVADLQDYLQELLRAQHQFLMEFDEKDSVGNIAVVPKATTGDQEYHVRYEDNLDGLKKVLQLENTVKRHVLGTYPDVEITLYSRGEKSWVPMRYKVQFKV